MSKFDVEIFAQTANRIREAAKNEDRLWDNPSEECLRTIAENEPGIIKTMYNSLVAQSEPTSRAAVFTRNNVDHSFGQEEHQLLVQCEHALAQEKLISIDRIVGNANSDITVRLTIPERFAHIALGGGNLFAPVKNEPKPPTYEIIMFTDEAFEQNKSKSLPNKDITIRLAMLDDGRVIKIVRNSIYIGEYKKGVFAAANWTAKTREGGIFLHAGCREDCLQSSHGEYITVSSLLIALSANGKTTTTAKILARKGSEKSWVIQDDGGTLMPDGSFLGFELGGLYAKTDSVNPGEQLEVFYGLLKPGTVCENVHVTEDGDFDFYNVEGTSNGRAVIRRSDFMHASSYIDVDRIDNFILITRGSMKPIISKLTIEQAVVHMILGQAMESSAGDPTQAGKIRSEFFYDPFMVGDKAQHANRLYEILKGLPHVNYFLMNTGGVGEGEHYHDIRLECTMTVLDSLIRGGLEDWAESPTGFLVPKAISGLDNIYLHPEELFSKTEFSEQQANLLKIERETIEKIGENLAPALRNIL